MFRLPCKEYLKGTCNNSFCKKKWHPPECLFYKSENGCRCGEKCSSSGWRTKMVTFFFWETLELKICHVLQAWLRRLSQAARNTRQLPQTSKECLRPQPPHGAPTGRGQTGETKVWPRPSLAKTKFGQTKFGQDQVWPDQVRDNQCSPCFLWRRRRPKAGNAFTQTRLVSAFRVSTGLHVEHRLRLGVLGFRSLGLRVQGLGFRATTHNTQHNNNNTTTTKTHTHNNNTMVWPNLVLAKLGLAKLGLAKLGHSQGKRLGSCAREQWAPAAAQTLPWPWPVDSRKREPPGTIGRPPSRPRRPSELSPQFRWAQGGWPLASYVLPLWWPRLPEQLRRGRPSPRMADTNVVSAASWAPPREAIHLPLSRAAERVVINDAGVYHTSSHSAFLLRRCLESSRRLPWRRAIATPWIRNRRKLPTSLIRTTHHSLQPALGLLFVILHDQTVFVAPLSPVLSHLPVWPSTRRLWPPPRSLPEGRGFGFPWVFVGDCSCPGVPGSRSSGVCQCLPSGPGPPSAVHSLFWQLDFSS